MCECLFLKINLLWQKVTAENVSFYYIYITSHIASHYSEVIMSAMAPQITSLTIVCTSVYSGADQRKYQSSASLAFVRGIHRRHVNSPHKGSVTRKMFPFDDVIMCSVYYNVDTWSVVEVSTLLVREYGQQILSSGFPSFQVSPLIKKHVNVDLPGKGDNNW